MDPVVQLVRAAVHRETDACENPYLTLETIVQRLYRKIADLTRVAPHVNEKTSLFKDRHAEILSAYETLRPNLTHDERVCVERVLSKDAPHPSELAKFAGCWLKHDARAARRIFAVDGLLGPHPRSYAQEAFCPRFARHNEAVRALHERVSDPEEVARIVRKALAEDEPRGEEPDPPELEELVRAYADAVGREEARRVAAERGSRAQQQQQQPCKRKRAPSPPPGSPAPE